RICSAMRPTLPVLTTLASLAVTAACPPAAADTIVQERFGCPLGGHGPPVRSWSWPWRRIRVRAAAAGQPRRRRVPVLEARRGGPAGIPDDELRLPRPEGRAGSLLLDALSAIEKAN
ncbi:hypothetical protein ACU4GR_32140, partial [Methylobacterium oryzae CBMB20]